MQIHCTNCHKPFALSKQAVLDALDAMTEESLNHYNAHCPHCRRANRVSRDALRHAAPDWHARESTQEEATTKPT